MTTRTELITRLNTAASQYYLLEYRTLMTQAADMLEADGKPGEFVRLIKEQP